MQILTNTILPTRRKSFVRRQRLLDALYQSLDFKLTLVTAAAGFGKTSLLVDFSHDIELPVCWLTLDESDSDPARLLNDLIASIAQRFPDFGKLTSSALADGAAVDEAAGTFINELVTAVPELFVLILDDYHLADTTSVNQVIEQLLRFMPEQVRLILSGRSTPSIDLISLAAKQEVFSIAPSELCFTVQETHSLFERLDLSRPWDPVQLTQQMRGWVTGIVLATQQESGTLAQVKPQADALDVIYVYLAQEVLEQQPPSVNQFLLQSSILSWMTPEACDTILGRSDSAQVLDYLQTHHLFIELVKDDGSLQYRYHPLFQEFLLEHLESKEPDEVKALHQAAGDFFAHTGASENAIHHFLAAEAFEQAAPLIDSIATELRRKNQRETLLSWHQHLGPHAKSAPKLMLAVANVIANQGDYKSSLAILSTLADDETIPESVRTNAKVQQGLAWYREGRTSETIEALAPLINEIQEPSDRASLLRVKGLCHQRIGEPHIAKELLLASLKLYRQLENWTGISHVLIDLSVVLLPLGEIETALHYQDEALEILRDLGRSSLLASNLNNAAFARHLLGQFQPAMDMYQDALFYAQQSGRLPDEALITLGQADLLRDADYLEVALEYYEKGLSIAKATRTNWLLSYAQIGLAVCHRLLGHSEIALSWQAQVHTSDAFLNARKMVEEGIVLGSQGRIDQGLPKVKQGRDQLLSQNAFPDLAATELLLGTLFLQENELQEAAAALNRALEAGARCDDGDMRLAIEARYHPGLLALGQAQNTNPPALVRLRQQIHQLDQACAEFTIPVSKIASSPELRIYSLGETRLQYGERSILAADWRRSSARTLFFYIADHPQVRRSDLILEFWPDSPRNKSTSQLQSTLYDARRTVGSEVLIYQASQESYQLNPEAQIWYDVAEFENALALAAERGPGRERARYLRQAIDLYTGPYLVDINTNWAGERRNELDTAFLQGVIDLGDCYLAERDFGEAHKWYQQALKIDNYREDVHRRIMLALASHGRKAEALRHYQHCVQILNDELGVAPDPATRALARKIQSS